MCPTNKYEPTIKRRESMSKERTIQIATYKGYEIQPAPDQLADSGE